MNSLRKEIYKAYSLNPPVGTIVFETKMKWIGAGYSPNILMIERTRVFIRMKNHETFKK